MIAICMETLFPIKSMGNSSRQRIMKGAKWEKVKKGKNWESGFHKERMVYTGRVTDPRTGKRIQKYFHKLQECRKWVADTQYEFAHGNVVYSENPTFKVWFFTGWNL